MARQPNARTSLDDLVTEDDIGNLSVRQLKEVLARNFIDYKGCIEKSELIQRVQQLFVSHQEEKGMFNYSINLCSFPVILSNNVCL